MLLIFAAIALAVLSPGPANLAIMAASMSHGRLAGVIFALGVQTGSAFWAFAAALGLSVWLQTIAWGLSTMKIAGGLYLLWLAFKSLRSALNATAPRAAKVDATSLSTFYWRGVALHLSNPKAVLSWLAVVSLIEATSDISFAQTFAGCILISGVIFQAYALVFGSPFASAVYRRSRRVIESVLAAVFSAAGLRLISS